MVKMTAPRRLRRFINNFIPPVITKLLCTYGRIDVVLSLIPQPTISSKHGQLHFYCPDYASLHRASAVLSKEPITIEWIDGFDERSVFWDIGANIGAYSIYAGARSIKTIAFEPGSGNFYNLNKNIEVNSLSEQITAFCIAISDSNAVGTLNLSDQEIGGAVHSFGESSDYLFFNNKNIKVQMHQGVFSYTLDALVLEYGLPFPDYIKIDVDGIEDRIILGSPFVMGNEKVKSVLVELDDNDKVYCGAVFDAMKSYGLNFQRKQLLYGSIGNFIFTR